MHTALDLAHVRARNACPRCEHVFIAIFVAGSANAFFESWMFSVGNLTSLMYWVPVAGVVARWAFRPESVREPQAAAGVNQGMRYSTVRAQN